MPRGSIPTGFAAAISDLLLWFRSTSTEAMIIGGIAVSLLGKPRTTQDIDSLVSLDIGKLKHFFDAGKKFGFAPRLSGALEFARQNRVLLMRHEESRIDVDMSLAGLPFETDSFSRMIHVKLGKISIPLPTPEDLIIMKAVAHRPKDLLDIESILEANTHLDVRRIKTWVKKFSGMLETTAMYEDLLELLKAKGGKIPRP